MEGEKKYSAEMDLFKGILVLLMIFAHCIQFFGEEEKLYQGNIVNYINLTTFPGFLFAYGFVCYRAYFAKHFQVVWKKMLVNALRTLFAFYLSSIAYFAFVEDKIFRMDLIRDVISIRQFGGWSEFLVSFSAVIIIGLVMFPVFNRLNYYGFMVIAVISLAACFIPYHKITIPQAALFLGSYDYITFPVIQYLVYFAAGIVISKYGLKFNKYLFAATFLISLPTAVYFICKQMMPERFPPSVLYVIGGAFFIYLYYVLCCFAVKKIGKSKMPLYIMNYVKKVGTNSLFYLLISNIFIFSFKGSAFWYKDFRFALGFYIFLLFVLNYIVYLVYKNKNSSYHINN